METKQPTTVQVTPEQMTKRIVRFGDLRPQSSYYDLEAGIPKEAYELITAKALYTLMAPSSAAGPMSAKPAIEGSEGLSVVIAECPPGDKPMLHAHFKTVETFLCLDGRFRIRWGDQGENETHIDRFDMISMPPGVCRDFTNVGASTAYLLVLITGGNEEDYNDIAFAPGESEVIKQRFGAPVMNKLQKIGFSFMSSAEPK